MAASGIARRHVQTAPTSHQSVSSGVDPAWVMPEYSTMPSQGNYFTNLLSQQGENIFGFDNTVDVQNDLLELNDMNSQPKAKGRSKNFSEQEDILLVLAHINIGKNAIIEKDQKDGKFWERIEKYFHVNKTFESDRNVSSLRHRWGTISRETNYFRGFLDKIERKNESGKTLSDKIDDAKAMFLEIKKKPFSVFHCWDLLKDERKFASQQDPNSQIGNEDTPRPPGRKAEKERARKCDENDSDTFIDEIKKIRESREETKSEWKARDDQFVEIEKSKLELEREQHDKSIMETDTRTMDDEAKQCFKFLKQEILARCFGSRLS